MVSKRPQPNKMHDGMQIWEFYQDEALMEYLRHDGILFNIKYEGLQRILDIECGPYGYVLKSNMGKRYFVTPRYRTPVKKMV